MGYFPVLIAQIEEQNAKNLEERRQHELKAAAMASIKLGGVFKDPRPFRIIDPVVFGTSDAPAQSSNSGQREGIGKKTPTSKKKEDL